MANSNSYTIDGHVFTVEWHRLNPNSSIERAEYNLFVYEDGQEIDSQTHVFMDEVSDTCRIYNRRARGKGREI